MHARGLLVLFGLAGLGCGEVAAQALPKIDANMPKKTALATFALG